MKLVLGIYTEMSQSSPVPVFERALSCIYEPLLSFLYNNPGYRLSMYQSSAMMKHLREVKPEFRSILTSLAKREEIEFITGSYSQAVLSLMPPKDRANQIEKLTAQIKHDYGVLPSTAFFYGQIWAPLYVSTLKTCGIDNIVISAYKATSKERLATDSFVMNELGRRTSVYCISDDISSLVSSYAQNEISFDEMKEKFYSFVDRFPRENCIAFINLDQMLEGSSREGRDSGIGEFLIEVLKRYSSSLVHIEDIKLNRPGYLDSGWYGRDAWATGLQSFNDIFVRNENFRYIFNRYISLVESCGRANKQLKREVGRYLFSIATGPLFIHDAQCTPLRSGERKAFWESILASENAFFEDASSTALKEYDLEELGENDYFSSNKVYTAVLSPKGGAVCEFDYRPKCVNIMDTKVPFDKSFPYVEMNKSFSDKLYLSGKEYSTSSMLFESDSLDKKRTDFLFTLQDDALPFSMSKHYKLRSSTFIVDVTIINDSDDKLIGNAESEVYLDPKDLELVVSDQRREMLTRKVVHAKTVRYTYRESGLQVVFSSTDEFSLREENAMQSQYTSLGFEDFGLYKKLIFSFPIFLEPGAAAEYRLVLRVNDTKEKETKE